MSEPASERERRPLGDLQPSQLLVSQRKLRAVLDWWDADAEAPGPAAPDLETGVEPLPYLEPVADLGLDPDVVGADRVVLADGHTRALAAVLTGADAVPVEREPDRDSLSMDGYRTCVDWCLDAEVRAPAALVGRVVSHETYLEEWVGRCRALVDGRADADADTDGS